MGESVAIVGSRDYPDESEVFAYVLGLAPDDTVVSGGALGVDMTAEGAARARGLTVISYRPVKRHGRWQIMKVSLLAGLPGAINALRPETLPLVRSRGLLPQRSDRGRRGSYRRFLGRPKPWDQEHSGALAEKAGKPLETRRPMAGKP
jgi:hypothetical protein